MNQASASACFFKLKDFIIGHYESGHHERTPTKIPWRIEVGKPGTPSYYRAEDEIDRYIREHGMGRAADDPLRVYGYRVFVWHRPIWWNPQHLLGGDRLRQVQVDTTRLGLECAAILIVGVLLFVTFRTHKSTASPPSE